VVGRVEDYAIVGDMQSVALICADGSVDDFMPPRETGEPPVLVHIVTGVSVGLLSEEYDPRYDRLVGNMPQAFSHVPLVQTALNPGGHAEEHRRGPWDERRSVPG
jgi:hypothetical protein